MTAAEYGLSRRQALGAAALVGAALAGPRAAMASKLDPNSIFPVPDAPKEFAYKTKLQKDADDQARLLDKLKVLTKVVKSQGKKASKTVKEQYKTVLEPLQSLLASMATQSDSKNKDKALAKADEFKGHMLELAAILESDDFTPFVSKTTGKTYKGGPVERELEEMAESTQGWFTALLSVPPPKDNFQVLKQAPPKVFPGGNALAREAKGF